MKAIFSKKNLTKLIFVCGFLICVYPIVSSYLESKEHNEAIKTYTAIIDTIEDEQLNLELKNAYEYNDLLFQTQGVYIGSVSDKLSDDVYYTLLDNTGTGIMGCISIPKIDVELPIYHGTDDNILSDGVGHLQASSLPVGGASTHAILTGHRGLPSSKLFTRLDEMKTNDFFYIDVCGEMLAYQVSEINIIEPDEVDKLDIEADKDIVSLITCTPYGINTHRLVVTGTRIPYEVKEKELVQFSMMSFREILFTVLPFSFMLFVIIYEMWNKRKEKKHEQNNQDA